MNKMFALVCKFILVLEGLLYDVIGTYKIFLMVDFAKNVFTYIWLHKKNVYKKQIKAVLFILKYSNIEIISHFYYAIYTKIYSFFL